MRKILLCICVCTCALASAQIGFSLASGSPISSTSNMKCVLSKDLNNDGKKDLLTSTAYGSQISAFLGNGSGQFSSSSTYTASGNGPIFMALADFNNDSKQDMAVANYNSNNISVFMGSSTGNFTAATSPSYFLGSNPYCVDAADFNMDGKMDIIACSANGYNVSLWFGNGSGSFAVAPSFPINTPAVPYYVCAGYFNQDAFPDFAYVSGYGNSLHVYINNGTGSFTVASGSPYTTGSQPRTIAVKDLNNDGFNDLVVPNALSDDVYIYMGSANGSFTTAASSPISLSSYPYQAAIADYDQNGTQDLAITCANTNQLYLLSGNGNGGFTAVGSAISVGNMPQSIVTDDFNSDGKADLAVADWNNNSINVFLNTSTVCAVSAGFTYTNGANGQVSFNSTSTGTNSTSLYSWNFGDGSAATGSNPNHTFANGTYTVTLTASNSTACVGTYTQIISICALSAGYTYTVLPSGQVNFFATSSGGGANTNYSWSFGDNTNGSGTTPNHSYANGTYTVTLNVTDTPGCTSSDSHVISVCVLSAGFTYTVNSNGQVNFNSTSTGAGSGANFSWSFGDNSSGSGSSIGHSYTNNGTYTVILNVGDSPGCNSSVSHVITIELITGIAESSIQNRASVYPNPTKAKLNIEVPDLNDAKNTRFILHAVNGSQVLNAELDSNKTTLNVSHLPAGVYFYKLIQDDNSLKQGRVVVEK